MQESADLIDTWWLSAKKADAAYVGVLTSKDGTAEKLAELGVYVIPLTVDPFRFDVARNAVLDAIPDDGETMCMHLDDDETIAPGYWAEIIREKAKGIYTRYRYDLLENGALVMSQGQRKCHKRTGAMWKYAVHEMVYCHEVEQSSSDLYGEITVTHRPSNRLRDYLQLEESAAKENPEDVRPIWHLAKSYLFRGRYEEAVKGFERYLMLGTDPYEKSRGLCYLATAYEKLGKLGKAESLYHQAISLQPDNRIGWYGLGLLYSRVNLPRIAFSHIERAITLPDNPLSWETWAALNGEDPPKLLAQIESAMAQKG
jgi:tetratricopeptide (TPR) repeat protein